MTDKDFSRTVDSDKNDRWLEAKKNILVIWRPLWVWGDKLSAVQKSLILFIAVIAGLVLCAVFFQAMCWPVLVACLYLAWNTVGTCRILFAYFYGWDAEPTKMSGLFTVFVGAAFFLLIHAGLRHAPFVGGRVEPIAIWEEK